jgi:hypothetical protein
VLPTIREHSKHCREHSPINDHQGDLKGHNDPCAFYEDILSLNHKHRCHIPFSVILAMSKIWSLVLPYLVQFVTDMWYVTCSRDIPSPWLSQVLRRFGCNLTEWAQSIFLSRGISNPALVAYVSTYSIGIPGRLSSYYRVTVDAVKAAAR